MRQIGNWRANFLERVRVLEGACGEPGVALLQLGRIRQCDLFLVTGRSRRTELRIVPADSSIKR